MDLKTYLFKNNLKQVDCARDCGLSPTIISHIVNGRTHYSYDVCDIISKWTDGVVKIEDMIKHKRKKCPSCGQIVRCK